MPGAGPPLAELVHYLALEPRAAFRAATRRTDAIDAYRAALERHGIDTEPWFERQLALCLVGVMVQLGWEKAFDETGDELDVVARHAVVDAVASAVSRRLSAAAAPCQSRRSGCSRTILCVERAEAEVARDVRADLAVGEARHVGVDEHRRARRLGEQLRLARALHRDEPAHRLVDRVADGEQPVVAQDHGLAVAERVRDALALFEVEHDARVVVEERRGPRRRCRRPG